MRSPFADTWADAIAEITTDVEFQNATIVIIDESLVTSTYNIDTGVTTVTGDPRVYQGQARVKPMRAPVNREGSAVANSNAITSVRVQLPQMVDFSQTSTPEYRTKRGWKMLVLTAPKNLSLLDYWFSLEEGLQGASAASRTLEFMVDGDATVDRADLPWLT